MTLTACFKRSELGVETTCAWIGGPETLHCRLETCATKVSNVKERIPVMKKLEGQRDGLAAMFDPPDYASETTAKGLMGRTGYPPFRQIRIL